MEGYTTAIEYKGHLLTVQTQDKGPAFNYVESLIFLGGKVIFSRRASYSAHLNEPDLQEIIKRLVEELHADVLDEIVEGKYDRFLE